MAVTLEDVGRKCGVSRSTVSRVINDSSLVNQRTKDRVMKAIKELSYAPNFIARSLTMNRTETLAVTLPDIVGGVFPEVLAGMDEVASQQGYHVLVVFLGGARPQSATMEKLVRNRRVDAVMTVANTLSDVQLTELASWKIPLVCVACKSPTVGIPSVLFDNHGGSVKATTHLLSLGRKQLIHLRGPKVSSDAEERSRGFRDAHLQTGLDIDSSREFLGDFTREGGARAVCAALERGGPFDGIVSGNDDMAIGAMEELTRRGIKIPGDVAIVGFDDIDIARFVNLSTVHVPLRELGRAATRAAFDMLYGREPRETELLPTELTVRASSKADGEINLMKM